MIRLTIATALAILPGAALAHPGHAAPADHIHWEILALGLAVLAVAAVALARR